MTEIFPDRDLIHRMMVAAKGSYTNVCDLWNNEGPDGRGKLDRKKLAELVKEDEVLSMLWGDRMVDRTSPPSEADVIGSELAKLEQGKVSDTELAERNDQMITAKGLEALGYSSAQVKKMLAYHRFSSTSFNHTLNITHGMMIDVANKAREEAEHLSANVIHNSDVVPAFDDNGKPIFDSNGKLVTRPRYTIEQKLSAVREFSGLIDQIRRIQSDSFKAAEIRLRALELANKQSTPKPKAKRVFSRPE